MPSHQWMMQMHRPLKLHLPDAPASRLVLLAVLVVLGMQSLSGLLPTDRLGTASADSSTALARLAHGI